MQKHVITLFLLCCTFFVTAQENTNDQNPYTQRDYSIGLDFQTLLRSPVITPNGTNLLFKKRLKKQNLFNPESMRHLRIQIGAFIHPEKKSDNGINAWKSQYYTILGGIEWQRQLKRWQLFYGLDTGVEYMKSTETNITFTTERSNIGIPLTAFIGLKFFLIPQVSISIESGPTGIFQWQDNEITSNGTISVGRGRDDKVSHIYMTFMRYLSLSYHF